MDALKGCLEPSLDGFLKLKRDKTPNEIVASSPNYKQSDNYHVDSSYNLLSFQEGFRLSLKLLTPST